MNRQAAWPPLRQFATVSVALRILAVIILGLVAAGAAYEVASGNAAIIRDATQQVARLDMVFAEQTGRAVETVDLLVTGAADAVEAARISGVPRETIDDALRRRIHGVRQLAGIFAVDENGEITAATNKDDSILPPALIHSLLERYRADPHTGMLITPPFRTDDGMWSALLTRPLKGSEGQNEGFIAGWIALSYFEDFYRAVELSENGAINLHLRDGTLLARFPHADDMIGSSYGALPPFAQVLAHAQAGTLEMTSPVDGSIRLLAVRALKTFPLAVIVSVGKADLLRHWKRNAITLVCTSVLLSGAVVVLLLVLSRKSQQREELLRDARASHQMAERARERLLQQIADKERAEEALQQAQRIEAVGKLTGGIAHDFNNLLTVVLGNVDLLRHRAEPDSALATRLDAIRTAAQRGAMLTSHLLAFARRQSLLPKPTDLNEVLRGMTDILHSALTANQRLVLDLADDLWPAMVDRNQIELMVLNLALNARDAMADGGTLTIQTRNRIRLEGSNGDGPPAGDYTSIAVRDTGVGIAPDILPHVFEPFFTTKAPGSGSGLGLSQVFGTAGQLGGGVRIESCIGSGTLVTVDVPRATTIPAGAAHARSVAGPRTGHVPAIVVVDDSDAARDVTVTMLRDLGYEVIEACDGATALVMLANNARVDLLLTDLVMPGMDGMKLADAARSLRPRLAIAFVSGYVDQVGDIMDPDGYLLTKPFTAADLRRLVESVLDPELQAARTP